MQEPQGVVPTTAEVRRRIERAGDQEMRMAFRYAFEICGRVSEVVGRASPGDRSPANGPKPEDATATHFKDEKAWVPSVRTSKHGGMVRKPGLPADYDPWVPELKSWFNGKAEGSPVFDFTRFNLGDYADDNDIFEGLVWRLEEYHIFVKASADGTVSSEVRRIPTHLVRFTVHRLRDARATNLLAYYKFNGYDLSVHGGWKPSGTVPGMSPVMAKYQTPIYENWQEPFPKLLKPLDA